MTDGEEFTVQSGCHTFRVNAEAISKQSDYFRALLDSGMQETITRKVSLPEFDRSVLEFVVRFVETGTCDVEEDLVEALLEVTSYLQMSHLTNRITDNLQNNLTVENCTQYRNLGDAFHNEKFAKVCDDFLCKHVVQYFQTEHFLNNSVTKAADLLGRNELWISDEYVVFEAVLKWISFNNTTDPDTKAQILSTIRFPLLTGRKFEECTETLKAMNLLYLCNDSVLEAKLFHEDVYSTPKNGKRFTPRRLIPCLLAAGGFTGKEHSTNRFQVIPLSDLRYTCAQKGDDVQFGNLRTPKFHSAGRNKMVKLPTALCEHCICALDDFLYVAGGQTQYCQDGRYTKNTVCKFDARTCQWTEVCPMQTARSLFYLCGLNSKLYAVGGWTAPDTVTRRVEFYDPVENKWTYAASLSIGLHEHAGCVANGTIFISGGYKGPYRGHLDNLWSYSADDDTWKEHRPMKQARSYHAMVSCDESRILVCGGVNYLPGLDTFEDVKDCEMYDITTNEWTKISQTLRCTSCASALQTGDMLYIFGGHSFEDENDHNYVQVLNTKTFDWQEVAFRSHNILHFASVIFHFPEMLVRGESVT